MDGQLLFQVYELVLKAHEEQLDVLQSQSLVDVVVALGLDLTVELLEVDCQRQLVVLDLRVGAICEQLDKKADEARLVLVDYMDQKSVTKNDQIEFVRRFN